MTLQKNTIFCGGNLEVVSSWPSNCISAIVTDPPYGLGFMGKDWDTFKDGYINEGLKSDKASYNRRKNKTFDHKAIGSPTQIHSPATIAGSYDFSRNPEFQQWFTVWAKAMLRITKPGGFLLCFGGTRTFHRLACAIEDAGWEIRDCMSWLYGSGFPKSHNISKAIDKAAGAKRKVIGKRYDGVGNTKSSGWVQEVAGGIYDGDSKEIDITTPATDLAQLWNGYGTALKPAWEPIIVAMKPLDGTFAHNAEAHQVAGLNIDGGRISYQGETPNMGGRKNAKMGGEGYGFKIEGRPDKPNTQGRWPANLLLSHHPDCWADENGKISCHLDCPVRMLDEQTQNVGSTKPHKVKSNVEKYEGYGSITHKSGEVVNFNEPNAKGASRFFYCAKTSRKERNMGMEDCEDKLLARSGGAQGAENRGEKEYLQKSIGLNRVAVVKNNHPTVKPLALMKYLCTLLKMPSADQVILDPFLGSGTTGMACKELGINFIGIEKEREYCEIAVKRIAAVPGKEITLETTLPVTKNVETFRTTKDFAGGSRRPNENLPHISEDRQSIINAAVAALRRNQK